MGLDRSSGCPKLRFLADDLPRKTLELFARLQSEILVESAARPLVDVECLRLATRAVERDHELRDVALPVRGLLDQPAQLAHELCMAPKGKIRVDADLERSPSKLVETLDLRAPVNVQRHAGEDRTVPEAQCLFREDRGSVVVAVGGRLRGLLHERLEDPRVENGTAEADPVSASPSLEVYPMRREHSAEPRDIGLQGVSCRGGRTLPPDLVDQALVGYDVARAKEQGSENGPLLTAAQLEGSFSDLGFERTEDAEPDWL